MANLPSTRRLVGSLGPIFVLAGAAAGAPISSPRDALPSIPLTQQTDSQSVLAAVREAQTAFERLRIHHLPRTLGGSRRHPDAVFGRMRYWDEDSGVIRQRPPEPERVIEARQALLATLDSAAALIPGDGWVTGQRVRYLVDGGELGGARRVAGQCRADPWWCDALLAFVAHLQDDFIVADSLFASSLNRMPTEQRCAWTDIRELLDPDLAASYREIPCSHRDSLNDRAFWLADPLHALPGNDRRTEHYARHVVHAMFDGTMTPEGDRWNEDNLALIRRYGWSEAWEQTQAPQFGEVSVLGYHRRRGEHFMPFRAFFESPSSIGWDDWLLDIDRARERYAPRYADRFEVINGQVATFRRSNGALLVAAFDVPTRTRDQAAAVGALDGLESPTDAIVALVASQDERSGMLIHRETADAEARLSLQIPALPVLLSVEALNRRDSVAARRRYWLDTPQAPPDQFGVSDLLLVDVDGHLPRSVEEALPWARTTMTFNRGDSIHIYWEMYGPAPLEPRSVTLVVIREDRSFLRRAVEWIGLAERGRPFVRLEWVDVPDTPARGLGRAMTLQLPLNERGRFRIRLEVTNTAGERVTAEREIVVEE